jgi:hypothetical protein
MRVARQIKRVDIERSKGATMRLPKQDIIATVLVAGAGFLYLLWFLGSAPLGLSGTRATGLVVLGLGFAASASAVVPKFDQLIHGNKTYLAATSLIGMVALVAGILVLLIASDTALGVLLAAMGTLWLIATIHHRRLAKHVAPLPSAEVPAVRSDGRRAAGVS